MKNVRFKVITAVVMKSSIFWDITPCSLFKVNQRSGGTRCLHLQGYPSTLKMEATNLSEMSVDFQRNTRRYIPENRTLNGKLFIDS
jgi:hypothetical protein